MIKITSLPTIAGALLALGLSAAPAHAGPNRTWVSGRGTDAGGCPVTAPCRTFAFALTQTAAGGEIDVVDPGGYGMVTITKAISIVNDGVGVAAIGVSSGNAITISAGATDSVHLRGLTIDGLGSGTDGIDFKTGGNLAIEDCVIRGFTNAGIAVTLSTSSTFSVSNTIASNNGISGIAVGASGSAVVTGVVSKVTTNNNNLNGIVVSASVGFPNVAIVDSEASNNGGDGVVVGAGFGQGQAVIMVRNVVASNNKTGLEADGTGATLRVAHSVVTGNGTGVATSGSGTIESYGDNDVDANTNNNTGVLITIPTH
jgi:Right handed beta helix region